MGQQKCPNQSGDCYISRKNVIESSSGIVGDRPNKLLDI